MKNSLLFSALLFCFLQTAYAQHAGDLDAAFGINGIIKADLGEQYNYGANAKKILTESDGSFYVVTPWGPSQFFIIKKNRDGSPDVTYGIDGFSTPISMEANSAARQQDGKIVMVGNHGNNFAIARYNTDGSPDATFNNGGLQTVNHYDYSYANDVAIQQDGKIVVTGLAAYYGVGYDGDPYYFATTRFNPDGSLDHTFGNDGWQTKYMGAYGAVANAVAIQPDGKIIVAGATQYEDYGGLIRYNSDGSPDPTFVGEDGNYSIYIAFNAIAIQSDGKIVVAGLWNKEVFAVVRYESNGVLDFSFGFQTQVSGKAKCVSLQNDGKIVVAGEAYSDNKIILLVARYNIDGSPDLTFSVDGMQTTDFGNGNSGANSVAIQSDGRIIAGGKAANGSNNDLAIARYTADGNLDASFEGDGKLTAGLVAFNTSYTCTQVQKDGKIVTAGKAWNGNDFDFAVARYNKDGSLDNTFSGDGKQITDFNAEDNYANAIAIQNDGKIIIAGSAIVRYNIDGSVDNTFSANGIKLLEYISIAIQKDQKILVTGPLPGELAVSRYNPDGSPDTDFSGSGTVTTSSFQFQYYSNVLPTSMCLQPDGKIVVAGSATFFSSDGGHTDLFVTRYNTDGTLDEDFGYFGALRNSNSIAQALALESDGSILVVINNKQGQSSLLKVNQNGDLKNTSLTGFGTGLDDIVKSIGIGSDDKIIVGGRSGGNFVLARFDKDADLDSTFGSDGMVTTEISFGDDIINALAISGNRLYAAGTSDYLGNKGILAAYLLDTKVANTVSVIITNPINNTVFRAPAVVKIKATISHPEKVNLIEFYNGRTLLYRQKIKQHKKIKNIKTGYKYNWTHVAPGNYTLTAKAININGIVTISEPVYITVVGKKKQSVHVHTTSKNQNVLKQNATSKDILVEKLTMKLNPNPVQHTLNISIAGAVSELFEISVLSASGVMMKSLHSINSNKISLNVSSLTQGIYIIKIISGDKVMYKQFLKM
ncbi:MAG: T9SS type A sorting domain-containing protein [Ginsengibacter sp.]